MDVTWIKIGLLQPGKSKKGLAQAMGIDPSAVSRILSGEREVKLAEVNLAAAYLGVEPKAPVMRPSGFSEAPAFGGPRFYAHSDTAAPPDQGTGRPERAERATVRSGAPSLDAPSPAKGSQAKGSPAKRSPAKRSQAKSPSSDQPRGALSPGALSAEALQKAMDPWAFDAPGVPNLPAVGTLERDLEVRGTAVGGEDAAFEFNGETVDYVRRPPGLSRNHKAFAVYTVGDSMSPRFEEGELVFVHPGRPAKPGNDVVVELHGRDGEPGNCYIKRLVARTPTKLVLTQFNPPKEIEFPLDQVRAVFRILTPGELLGT